MSRKSSGGSTKNPVAANSSGTPLHPRTGPEPSPPQEITAEDRSDYAAHPQQETKDPGRTRAEATADATPNNPDPSQPPRKQRGGLQPTLADDRQPNLLDKNDVEAPTDRPEPEVPNLYEAGLALHACLPDGQKVEWEPLLHDAARELGHQKLTRKVRRALNKALNAEHNTGRLKTDWQRVWKPRNK